MELLRLAAATLCAIGAVGFLFIGGRLLFGKSAVRQDGVPVKRF